MRLCKSIVAAILCAAVVVIGIAANEPSGEGTIAPAPAPIVAISPESATNNAWGIVQQIYGKAISEEMAVEIINAVVWQEVSRQISQLPNTEQGKARLEELRKMLNGTPEQKAATYCALMRATHTGAYQAYEAQRAHEAAGKKLQEVK